MKPYPLCFISFTTLFLTIIVFQQFGENVALSSFDYGDRGNQTDHEALLAIKSQLIDGSQSVLRSWNHSIPHCSWEGITCGHKHNRVVVLVLLGKGLGGTLSPFIGNLSFLRVIAMPNNSLGGEIPIEIGKLFRLRSLYLYNNNFTGQIPANISGCINLQMLSVGMNNLRGELPVELGKLSNLKILGIFKNKLLGHIFKVITNLTSLEILYGSSNAFSGTIPGSISKMRNLVELNLAFNELSGSIPDSISRIPNLMVLSLSENKISGKIPPSIFNLSSLQDLYLADNQLRGNIPLLPPLTLSKLQNLVLANNYLSGSIPITLLNHTTLQRIQLHLNRFTGTIPHNFGQLYNLKHLQIASNSFVGDINVINTLINCSKLEYLDLSINQLTGIIPQTIANLSVKVSILSIGENPISGGIPLGLGNLINLEMLYMAESGLKGTIPQDLGKLQKLFALVIFSNTLKGEVPSSFGNLSLLTSLDLDDNKLEGRIPPSLGNCANLLYLNLSSNNFNGSIPFELFGTLPKFVILLMNSNKLEGIIPLEITEQIQLIELGVCGNKLSGTIPEGLGDLLSLTYLDMHDNSFHGSVPPFANLKSLLVVDLSHNNLSGPLPEYFSKIPLIYYLNLSYNNFEGIVPTKGVFANASAISLVGNIRICGGIPELHLPRCIIKKEQRKMLRIGVPIICALVGTLAIVTCIWLYLTTHYKKGKQVISTLPLVKEPFMKVSYDALLKATNGFSVKNLLGSGRFGSVFKGILDGNTIAVKVFDLEIRGGSKSFIAECETLRKIRHRNLVGIITSCSSIDFQGKDFKAIVFELMSNGSLDAWLHEGQNLNLLQRMDIAIDVALALEYLHQECGYQIIHCDLKPSNILLDEDLVAHVGDFGLVKVLGQSLHRNQSSSIGVKGTVGYIAPEYGLGGEASVEADHYSYGIVLLELITGKRPTNNMFKEDWTLHMYAKTALPDQVLHIVDSKLLEVNGEEVENKAQRIMPVLQIMVEVGVACSNAMPNQRMPISEAIVQLQRARDILLKIHPSI